MDPEGAIESVCIKWVVVLKLKNTFNISRTKN